MIDFLRFIAKRSTERTRERVIGLITNDSAVNENERVRNSRWPYDKITPTSGSVNDFDHLWTQMATQSAPVTPSIAVTSEFMSSTETEDSDNSWRGSFDAVGTRSQWAGWLAGAASLVLPWSQIISLITQMGATIPCAAEKLRIWRPKSSCWVPKA